MRVLPTCCPGVSLERVCLSLLCGVAAAFLPPASRAVEQAQAPGELIVEDDLSGGMENWVWVGPPGSVVEFQDGALLLDPREATHRPPGVEGINVWFRRPLDPGDWAIEFDIEPLEPGPLDGESTNLLFMVDYRPLDGEPKPLEEAPQPTGHYALLHGAEGGVEALKEKGGIDYRPMTGYTITYYRINPNVAPTYMMVVRSNPGFHLVGREIQTAEDQWQFRHTVRIERRGRELKLYQDDKLALEASDAGDEAVPSGGYFGLRSWKARAKLHGVRVYRLEPPRSAQKLELTKEIALDPEAWRWNMAPWDMAKVVSFNGYQYSIWWGSDTALMLGRRNLADDTVQTMRFSDVRLSRPNDAHNSTAIGISPRDGRLHLSYDHHAQPLNYRMSIRGFLTDPPETMSESDFLDPQGMAGRDENRVTYPKFMNLNDDTLLFLYRNGGAGSGHLYLNRYDDEDGSWDRMGRLFSGDGHYFDAYGSADTRGIYPNDIVIDDNGRIHITWTYREGTGDAVRGWGWKNNHDIHYIYSDDDGITWANNADEKIADLRNDEPVTVDSPGIVVIELPLSSWLINQDAMTVDSGNQPHIVTHHSPVPGLERPEKTPYIHYWRTKDGSWHSRWIEDPAEVREVRRGRGVVVMDSEDTLFFLTRLGETVTCFRAESADGWSQWTVTPLLEEQSGEGWRFDIRRWRETGVLTIPLVGKDGSYGLADLELIPAAPTEASDRAAIRKRTR